MKKSLVTALLLGGTLLLGGYQAYEYYQQKGFQERAVYAIREVITDDDTSKKILETAFFKIPLSSDSAVLKKAEVTFEEQMATLSIDFSYNCKVLQIGNDFSCNAIFQSEISKLYVKHKFRPGEENFDFIPKEHLYQAFDCAWDCISISFTNNKTKQQYNLLTNNVLNYKLLKPLLPLEVGDTIHIDNVVVELTEKTELYVRFGSKKLTKGQISQLIGKGRVSRKATIYLNDYAAYIGSTLFLYEENEAIKHFY